MTENNNTLNENRKKALAAYLEINPDEISESRHDEQRLEADGHDWLVLTDEEADERVKEEIKNLVWAFNADFLEAHSGVDAELFSTIQETKCESANEMFLKLIKDFDDFVSDAVAADGRGHFLAGYDDYENEQQINGEMFYIYKN